MSFTRREFLKTALMAAGGALQSTLPGHFQGADGSPNVIILVLDCLSARHLSLYGYPRQTAPNLQSFAATANVYHRHYAAGNFTSPGTASLFTGAYPWTHRAFQQAGLIARDRSDQNLFRLLNSSYHKAAFTQNIWADLFLHQFNEYIDTHIKSTSFSLVDDVHYDGFFGQKDALASFRAYDDFLDQDFGLPGSLFFSVFDELKSYVSQQIRFSGLEEEYPRGIPNFAKYKLYFLLEDVFHGVFNEIKGLQNPFVGYFHLWSPHEPYTPHRQFIGRFDDGWMPPAKPSHPLGQPATMEELGQARREYDEYIANLDAEFAKFYDSLLQTGILENSYLIVTSDHGQLFERGVHGHVTPLLYDPVIHIPLIISAPGQTTRRDFYSPTSCVDVLPTILKITNSDQPASLEGTVLPGFGENENSKPVFVMEAKKNSAFQPLTTGTFAMFDGDYKLIWYRGYEAFEDTYELYNLKADPEELNNLSISIREMSRRMAEQLKQKLAECEAY